MKVFESPRGRLSLLSMAAWQRLACASVLVVMLWTLVSWALGGDA
jgi:hypothetical protein